MFTEPINKSDRTGLKQQEDFPKEGLKGTQSTNEPFSNVLGVMQNGPGLLFLTNPRFSHCWGTKKSLIRVARR